mgnify:CR=1 FL=1
MDNVNKFCPICKKLYTRDSENFFNNKKRHDGLSSYCKKCHIADVTNRRNLSSKEHMLIYSRSAQGARRRGIKFDLDKEIFKSWYESSEKKCCYCDITVETMSKIKWSPLNDRQSVLMSIDRKDSNVGYTQENIVLCCYSCNVVKNSVLSYEQMLDVGQRHMKQNWTKLLN